ncbi:MAG: dihydrofolate reductase [Oligoflexia bacterium]|nr:dihydrofolate reductase [Oligoflexia bacterium]
MNVSLVVAMSENRVIGIENRLPWNIPEDLKRFKQITSGHPIIMGRKTYESIGRLLPNRTNIIISRNKDYRVQNAIICHSLSEAIEWAQKSPGSDEIFVIGGGEIFKQAIPLSNKIYLTKVLWAFEGDAYFPEFDEENFDTKSEEKLSDSPPSVLQILSRKKTVFPWTKAP